MKKNANLINFSLALLIINAIVSTQQGTRKMQQITHKEKLEQIKYRLFSNQITYQQAKADAKPIIDEMNSIGREIAARHGRKFRGFSFAAIIR